MALLFFIEELAVVNLIISIPALNEERTIARVIESLPKKIPGVENISVQVIDDGSTDRTVELAKKSGAHVFSHGANLGVGAAFHSAVDQALECGADILVTIDADGQFDSNDISRLVSPILKKNADFVTANRFAEKKRPKNMSRVKFWGNQRMSHLISKISGKKIKDAACGFRAYGRDALLNLNLLGKFTYTQETILDLCFKNFRLVHVPIVVKYFPERKSRVVSTIRRYAVQSFLIILKSYRDYRPMRFFGYTGLLIFLAGIALDIFVFVHYFQVGTFSPYKAFGFLGGLLNLIGVLTGIMGLLADMLTRQRLTQEKILYLQKSRKYAKK
ncbi:glycosyltransferase family 2 protein [bacterium]|nr:glycosyltransferase family 2 protein [bacterium]MBT6832263.1 glycosyltransferase family 2 protein [bacterium]MBT6996200.1 glycosyltransferase family 2 protein [bacterium]